MAWVEETTVPALMEIPFWYSQPDSKQVHQMVRQMGRKILQNHARKRGNAVVEKGRFAILNQVTFNRAQEDVRETVQVSRGRTVQMEGAASAGALDFAHSVPCLYRLFLFNILVILKITLSFLGCPYSLAHSHLVIFFLHNFLR